MAQRPPPTPMLQAFVCAGQTGSFARAAVELNLTASAISHQVGGLEQWWGVQLFERHSRGVKLTAAGRALLPVARTFFTDLDAVLQSLKPGTSVPLHLYCTSSLCATWLTPRVHAHHELNLLLTSTELSNGNLNAHPYDVAMVMGDGHYPGNHVQLLMRDGVFPVCSAGFAKAHGPIAPAEVSQYPLIHRVDDPLCPGWEDWFAWQGLNAPPDHHGPRFPDSNLAISLAAKGAGIALGRTALVHDQLRDGSLVALDGPVMPSPSAYYLICRSGREQEPAIARLIEWIKAQVAEFEREVRLTGIHRSTGGSEPVRDDVSPLNINVG